jgi:hypothetical protein
VEGEVKQEGGNVNAWCVPMSQIRNRETLMAVRPRDEGRASVFKGQSRDKWVDRTRNTQTNTGIESGFSGAQARMTLRST